MSDEETDTSDFESETEDTTQHKLKKNTLKSLRPKFYIAREFIDDVNIFVNKCSLVPRLDWQTFVHIFNEAGYDTILCGRKGLTDTLDFTEEAISVMKGFFVKPNIYYHERKIALFLLYTLCRFQPIDCFAFAWFTPQDKNCLDKFTNQARSQRDLEALYCLGTMHARGLIRFTAASQEYGLTSAFIHFNSEYIRKTKADLINNNPMSNDEIKDIVQLCTDVKEYCSAKRKVTEHSSRDGERETLMYVEENATRQLCEDLLNLQCRTLFSTDPLSDIAAQEKNATRAELMEERKRKAMSSPVKPVRHLVSLGDHQSPTKSSRGKKIKGKLKNTDKSPKKGKESRKRKRINSMGKEGSEKHEATRILAQEFCDQMEITKLPIAHMSSAMSGEMGIEMGSANLPLEEILNIQHDPDSEESRAPLEAQFCEEILPTPSSSSSPSPTWHKPSKFGDDSQ